MRAIWSIFATKDLVNLRNIKSTPTFSSASLAISTKSFPFLGGVGFSNSASLVPTYKVRSHQRPWRLKKKWDGSWSRWRTSTTQPPPSCLRHPTKSSLSARDPPPSRHQSPAYTPPSSPTNISIPSSSTRHYSSHPLLISIESCK